jgi:hypothetical protein
MLMVLRIPPKTGPTTYPRPVAPPMKPRTDARSDSLLISPAYAWATLTFPPVIPSKTRAAKRTATPPVTPHAAIRPPTTPLSTTAPSRSAAMMPAYAKRVPS